MVGQWHGCFDGDRSGPPSSEPGVSLRFGTALANQEAMTVPPICLTGSVLAPKGSVSPAALDDWSSEPPVILARVEPTPAGSSPSSWMRAGRRDRHSASAGLLDRPGHQTRREVGARRRRHVRRGRAGGHEAHTRKSEYPGEKPAGPSHEAARVAPITAREYKPGGPPEREYPDTRCAGRLPARLEPWRTRSMPLLEAGPDGPDGPQLRHPGSPRATCRRARRS